MKGSAPERLARIGLSIPDLLFPGPQVDHALWVVAACDQHVHDDSYWERAKRRIGNAPSSLALILPEADLHHENLDDRISYIHRSMDRYLDEEILRPQDPGMVIVRRTDVGTGVRDGLLVAFDLEAEHCSESMRFALRATEKVVQERIPARLAIRERAAIELPHLLALADDEHGKLARSLDAAITRGRQLYQTGLPECNGELQGILVEAEDDLDALIASLESIALARDSASPYCWFVGDGNHSLETARRHWNNLRAENDMDVLATHPARYLMAELVPLQSPGIEILPVHRRVRGVAMDNLIGELELVGFASQPCSREELRSRLDSLDGNWVCGCTHGGKAWGLVKQVDRVTSCIDIVDGVLDALHSRNSCMRIDYLHGWEEVFDQTPGDCAIVVRPHTRDELAHDFHRGCIHPRKSFSLGRSSDKRHYLEARRLR